MATGNTRAALATCASPDGSYHHLFRTLPTSQQQLATVSQRQFHDSFNLLSKLPPSMPSAGDAAWTVMSQSSGAPFHLDTFATEAHAIRGSKVWATLSWSDAQQHGITEVDIASTKPHFTWSQLLACPSFRWFTLAPGDTLIMPADRLHGTFTLGSESTLGIGYYICTGASLPWQLHHWRAASFLQPQQDELDAFFAVLRTTLRLRRVGADLAGFRRFTARSYAPGAGAAADSSVPPQAAQRSRSCVVVELRFSCF
jgi:hypothetical protein